MAFININGTEYYYQLHGSGEPLALISGYTCDHTLWLPILEPLAQHFQVLLFDNRGVGQTKDDGSPLTAELMADDLILLLRALGLKKAHIAGQSMGGTIAQSLAGRYGDELGKLILMVTTCKWRRAMLTGTEAMLDMRRKNVDPALIFKMILAWVFGEDFLQDPEKIAFIKNRRENNPYPQSLRDQERQYNVLRQFDGRENLSRIKNQTLVIQGKEDIVAMPYETKTLAKGISGSTWVECHGAHGGVADNALEVARVITEFIRKT